MTSTRPDRARHRWHSAGAIACTLAAIALPKCPACITAWLSLLGVGVGVGTALAGWLRPALLVTSVALALLVTWWRARSRPSAARPDLPCEGCTR